MASHDEHVWGTREVLLVGDADPEETQSMVGQAGRLVRGAGWGVRACLCLAALCLPRL